MHLSNCKIVSNLNYTSNEFGMDCYEKCLDKFLFKNYKPTITYNFNSRGFRDDEWPTNIQDLKQAVWCLGESFTMGVGSAIECTWPKILQNNLDNKTRIINVSLDGASNTWISRKALDIIEEIYPHNMIIAWTFIGRDENSNLLLPDEQRKMDYNWKQKNTRFNSLLQKLQIQIDKLEKKKGNCNLIHLFVPSFDYDYTVDNIKQEIEDIYNLVKGASWPSIDKDNFNIFSLPPFVKNELQEFKIFEYLHNLSQLKEERIQFDNYIKKLQIVNYEVVDIARDGFHFDVKTATLIANNCLSFIPKSTI